MSIIIGDQDLIRITLRQRLFSQTVLNVFYFVFDGATESSTADSDNIWAEFKAVYVDQLRGRLSTQLTFDSGEITHMESPDFSTAVYPIGENGQVIGDCMPPMVTTGMQYRMTSRIVRTGYKRFSGVPENDAVNGGIGAPYDSLWEAIALGWSQGTEITNDLLAPVGFIKPVVVSSKNWVDGVPSVFRRVDQIVWISQLGTQNTRKIGRGS